MRLAKPPMECAACKYTKFDGDGECEFLDLPFERTVYVPGEGGVETPTRMRFIACPRCGTVKVVKC